MISGGGFLEFFRGKFPEHENGGGAHHPPRSGENDLELREYCHGVFFEIEKNEVGKNWGMSVDASGRVMEIRGRIESRKKLTQVDSGIF